MKKKTKIVVATVAVAITSLMITAYHQESVSSLVSEVVAVNRTYTPPDNIEPLVAEEIAEISTLTEEITQPTNQQEDVAKADETPPPQPTEKEKTDTNPTPTTQTATKPTTPPAPISTEPKNGDTRIVNGKQQGYLLGFGWVDYMGENEVIYCDDMYENGNKVGIMD